MFSFVERGGEITEKEHEHPQLTGQNISDSLHISLSDSPLEIFTGLRFLCG